MNILIDSLIDYFDWNNSYDIGLIIQNICVLINYIKTRIQEEMNGNY
ncbi:MAG: hypothetical protein ACRCZO_04670 [Cetobacterium sp.]